MTERDEQVNEVWSDVAIPIKEVILRANTDAQEIVRHRSRTAWLEIGEGCVAIRTEALRRAGDGINNLYHPRYRYFQSLLMTKAPDLKAMEDHDRTGCQHAVWMHEHWGAIESWLATLTLAENNRLNHPSAVKRRFDAAHKRKPQGLEKPPTKAARQAARIEQLQNENRDLKDEVRDLREQLREKGQ